MRLRAAPAFAKAFVIGLFDSTRIDQFIRLEELSSLGHMSSLAPLLLAGEEGRAILSDRPRLFHDGHGVDWLRALPEKTVGRTYVDHLDRAGLDATALNVPLEHGIDEQSDYLLDRVRQTHDICHALLGLGVEPYEEVLVHTFLWA